MAFLSIRFRPILKISFLCLSCFLSGDVDAQADIKVHLLVTPQPGVELKAVTPDALQIQQDGRTLSNPQTSVQQPLPLRLGLVFDESGSGRRSSLRSVLGEHVLDWSSVVIDQFKGDAFLVGFNDLIITSTEITPDVSQLRSALKQLQPVGGSAIRDALVHSTQKFWVLRGTDLRPSAKVIILVSDGYDNASLFKEQKMRESAQGFDVRVYAISFPSREAAFGRGFLEELAKNTGGKAFFPRNEAEVDKALAAIAADLQNSLLMNFVPETHDGKFHNLTVTFSNGKNSVLRAAPKFYAPSPY